MTRTALKVLNFYRFAVVGELRFAFVNICKEKATFQGFSKQNLYILFFQRFQNLAS